MKRIVAIAPHSDDVELGLGAYLYRLGREGGTAKVFVMASGNASFTRMQQSMTGEVRVTEGFTAYEKLPHVEVHYLGAAPDGGFNEVPHGALVKAVEGTIYNNGRVDEFYMPLPSFHTDHTLTYDACIGALRPRMNRSLPLLVYAYEYPGQAWGPAPPSYGKHYKAVTKDDLDGKIGLLQAHDTQWVSVPDAPVVGENAVRALAGLRGSESMVEYAEMFYMLRGIEL